MDRLTILSVDDEKLMISLQHAELCICARSSALCTCLDSRHWPSLGSWWTSDAFLLVTTSPRLSRLESDGFTCRVTLKTITTSAASHDDSFHPLSASSATSDRLFNLKSWRLQGEAARCSNKPFITDWKPTSAYRRTNRRKCQEVLHATPRNYSLSIATT